MNQSALEPLLPELRAIPTRNVLRPQEKGISHFLQQTENLCFWYRPHREALVGPGLSAEMLDELPLRLAACREAQAQWIAAMQNKTPKQQKLDDIEGKAENLLKELKRRLRHLALIGGKPETSFYPNLKHRRLRKKDRRTRQLRYQLFAATARRYREELTEAGLENGIVDRATQIGREWVLAAAARNIDSFRSDARSIRDRAYTYLQELEHRIRRVGKFVFEDDPDCVKGYCG